MASPRCCNGILYIFGEPHQFCRPSDGEGVLGNHLGLPEPHDVMGKLSGVCLFLGMVYAAFLQFPEGPSILES